MCTGACDGDNSEEPTRDTYLAGLAEEFELLSESKENDMVLSNGFAFCFCFLNVYLESSVEE